MKRIAMVSLSLMLSAILIFADRHVPAQASANTTNVCNTIGDSTSWTLANSPYLVCTGGLTVGPTATLTIQPGVTVQFTTSVNSKLSIGGAIPTAPSPM